MVVVNLITCQVCLIACYYLRVLDLPFWIAEMNPK